MAGELMFRCPKCGETYDLADGIMALDSTSELKGSIAREGAPAIKPRSGEAIVAILCGVCILQIVAARAGYEELEIQS